MDPMDPPGSATDKPCHWSMSSRSWKSDSLPSMHATAVHIDKNKLSMSTKRYPSAMIAVLASGGHHSAGGERASLF